MQTHNLQKSEGRHHRRIGRGGKRGSFSGKGIKGQKARSGHRIRPQIRDIIKKLHKRRGYFFSSIKDKPAIVNLADLEKKFKNGDIITPKALVFCGLVKTEGNKMPKIKILGGGKLTKKLIFDKDILMSESVKKQIGV